MQSRTVKKRHRFFLAVEGESERSFVTWLQQLSDTKVFIHLHCYPLGGGGFKSMLQEAIQQHGKQSRRNGVYWARFLIVDGDRAEIQDWTLNELRKQAEKADFTVIVQMPNHEGLLYRMLPGKENHASTSSTAMSKLRSGWPDYQKPSNAQKIGAHFTYEDLIRVAKVDVDLEVLMTRIGLLPSK